MKSAVQVRLALLRLRQRPCSTETHERPSEQASSPVVPRSRQRLPALGHQSSRRPTPTSYNAVSYHVHGSYVSILTEHPPTLGDLGGPQFGRHASGSDAANGEKIKALEGALVTKVESCWRGRRHKNRKGRPVEATCAGRDPPTRGVPASRGPVVLRSP